MFWLFIIGLLIGASLYLVRLYMIGNKNIHNPRIANKTVIVTGGTAGIGKECVFHLC